MQKGSQLTMGGQGHAVPDLKQSSLRLIKLNMPSLKEPPREGISRTLKGCLQLCPHTLLKPKGSILGSCFQNAVWKNYWSDAYARGFHISCSKPFRRKGKRTEVKRQEKKSQSRQVFVKQEPEAQFP